MLRIRGSGLGSIKDSSKGPLSQLRVLQALLLASDSPFRVSGNLHCHRAYYVPKPTWKMQRYSAFQTARESFIGFFFERSVFRVGFFLLVRRNPCTLTGMIEVRAPRIRTLLCQWHLVWNCHATIAEVVDPAHEALGCVP